MAHAKLSPSSAHRWLNCPGSVHFTDDKGSVYADEGTAAHQLAEMALRTGRDADNWIGAEIVVNNRRFKVDEEMAGHVQVYLDTVRGIADMAVNPIVAYEKELDLTHWVPEGFGTGDAVIVEPLGALYIVDLKYGAGVAVDVWTQEEGLNPQLGLYALGALGPGNPMGVEQVFITVAQPRAPHADGPVRTFAMPVEDLLRWGENVIRHGAAVAASGSREQIPGAWCRWCKGLAVCEGARRKALAAADILFPDDTPVPTERIIRVPPAESLTTAQLERVYMISTQLLEPWLKAVKSRFMETLQVGGPTDHYKLVAGRATRKWGDTEEVERQAGALLGLEAYEPAELKSPAQMEKTLKATGRDPKALKHLVVETRGVAVARIDDSRPALPAGVEAMFGEE